MPQNLLPHIISDKTTLESLIPQRFPIVMVDKLLYFSNKKVVSGLHITSDNMFSSEGYFTEMGLIENMAQTVALHTGYQFFINNKPAPIGYIGAIKKTVIRNLPKIDDDIKTTAYILHEIMDVTLVKVSIEHQGNEIASAEMKTVVSNN